jgi:hypothetical protein
VLSAVDHLILDLGLGARRATGRDLEMIRLHVAQAGFDPQATFPADRRVVGLRRSNGQIIRRGDMLPTTSSTTFATSSTNRNGRSAPRLPSMRTASAIWL